MGSRAALKSGGPAPWVQGAVGGLLLLGACREPGVPAREDVKPASLSAPPEASSVPASLLEAVHEPKSPAAEAEPPLRPLRRCFPELPVWAEAPVPDLLDRAGWMFEQDDPAGALACAEEAARQAPRSIEAHHDRASALLRLGRIDDALLAVTLVLAMAPQDVEALELAGDLFINHLPPSSERANVGLEYVVRAQRLTGRDRPRLARLALLEGQALIDLGRAREALRPLERAAAHGASTRTAARYELGVALFELARFEEARQKLEAVLAAEPDSAPARYHLGLVLERAGEMALAEAEFARASTQDPETFPPPIDVPPESFAERVRQAVAALPSAVQEALKDIPVETAELPALEDLIAETPPLSPTILGLFRGLPLGQEASNEPAPRIKSGRVGPGRAPVSGASSAGSPAQYAVPERAIVLYRRNLLRSVRGQPELDAAIRRTLLHEVGHLHGEDDGSLRDRGLE